jgi:uncharacterized protein YggE
MNTNLFKFTALALFLVIFAAAIYVYRPTHSNLTRVTVTGDSQTKVAPDTAVIIFAVVTQGKNAVDAQQENARKSEAVKKAVEAATADAKIEVRTNDYSLTPEQDYYSGKLPKILGYDVKNTVTVSLDKLNLLGAVIDAATGAGANSVEGVRFVLGESSPAQGEALALASKQAMAKAESVARSLNGKIVRVVQAAEGGVPAEFIDSSANAAVNSNTSMNAEAKRGYSTPVQSGKLDVRSQVVLVVDIAI